jgi:hypothetical protein
VPDVDRVRYDIYVVLNRGVSKELLENSILPAIDYYLEEVNIEYSQKRKSKRLNPPCLHIMDPGWEENVTKRLIESGRRDIQYKWQNLSDKFIDVDKEYVRYSIHGEE